MRFGLFGTNKIVVFFLLTHAFCSVGTVVDSRIRDLESKRDVVQISDRIGAKTPLSEYFRNVDRKYLLFLFSLNLCTVQKKWWLLRCACFRRSMPGTMQRPSISRRKC